LPYWGYWGYVYILFGRVKGGKKSGKYSYYVKNTTEGKKLTVRKSYYSAHRTTKRTEGKYPGEGV
jgi:hypothetical protein